MNQELKSLLEAYYGLGMLDIIEQIQVFLEELIWEQELDAMTYLSFYDYHTFKCLKINKVSFEKNRFFK